MDDPVPSEPPHSRRLAATLYCARHRMMPFARSMGISAYCASFLNKLRNN